MIGVMEVTVGSGIPRFSIDMCLRMSVAMLYGTTARG